MGLAVISIRYNIKDEYAVTSNQAIVTMSSSVFYQTMCVNRAHRQHSDTSTFVGKSVHIVWMLSDNAAM